MAFTTPDQRPEQVQTMQVISYTDARNSLKAVIDKVIDDQVPMLIHRREGGNAVLMSEEAYPSMQETFCLMSNPANARALLRSIEQAKAGKAKKLKSINTLINAACPDPSQALANQNHWWVTCQAIGHAELMTPIG